MSLAIRWGDDTEEGGGFIFFDAVTAYTRSDRGQVTKHPIALGSTVTDHFIKSNPTITLSAVISGADISTNTYLVQDSLGYTPYNSQQPPTAVSVNSSDLSVLQKFLPDSIGQFLPDSSPDISMDVARDDLMENIRESLVNLNSGVKYNEKTSQFDPNIELVRLFEYDNISLRKIINNLVVTNISFKETPDGGYGLYFDMTLEQVSFALLKKTVIPKDVVSSLKKKAATKADKGKVDSTPQVDGSSDSSPKDIDPLREARAN